MHRKAPFKRSLSSCKELKLPKIDSRRSSLNKNSVIQQQNVEPKLLINKKLSIDSKISNKTAYHQNSCLEEN